MNDIFSFIYNNNVTRSKVIFKNIKNVHIKAREFTKLECENDFSYKYFVTRNGAVKITHHGDIIVITLYSSDTEKVYRTISCRTNVLVENLPKMYSYIGKCAGEYEMRNNWDM